VADRNDGSLPEGWLLVSSAGSKSPETVVCTRVFSSMAGAPKPPPEAAGGV
jgi:hypothetical protein